MNKYQDSLSRLVSHASEDIKYATEQLIDDDRTLRGLIDKVKPYKPMIESDGYWDGELVYDIWVCPNCEKRYELDYEHYEYCPNCGQHLDWSGYDL